MSRLPSELCKEKYMNKLIHRKTCKRLIYKIEFKYDNPLYTPIEGLYIARIYKRVRQNTFAPTRVRFAHKQGTKPLDAELEKLLREYEQTAKRTL